jgi:signal transduction histidine kinase
LDSRVLLDDFRVVHPDAKPVAAVGGPTDVHDPNEAAAVRLRVRAAVNRLRRVRVCAREGLLSLVNDLLDSAKLAAGKMEFRVDIFDISAVARQSLITLESLTDEKRVMLVWEGEKGILCSGDPRRSEQVLLNLLSNALKFTSAETQVRVRVRADLESVAVLVSDAGVGIASDQLERIFDEYAQVDDGSRQAVQGTGLGLPLSRRVAEMMKGSLTVSSVVGEGSTFTFTLPTPTLPAGLRPVAGA